MGSLMQRCIGEHLEEWGETTKYRPVERQGSLAIISSGI